MSKAIGLGSLHLSYYMSIYGMSVPCQNIIQELHYKIKLFLISYSIRSTDPAPSAHPSPDYELLVAFMYVKCLEIRILFIYGGQFREFKFYVCATT